MSETKIDNANFEQYLNKLEAIVAKLESGTTTLQDMIKLYEEGVATANNCKSILNSAELKITRLNPDNLAEEEFSF